MNVENMYYIAEIVLFLVGVTYLKDYLNAGKIQIRYRRDIGYRVGILRDELLDKSVDPIFLRIGMKLSTRRYDAIRQMISLVIIFLSIMKILEGDYISGIRVVLLVCICYFASAPKLTYRGRKTPFFRITDYLTRKRGEKYDEELTSIIVQMKNLIISKGNGMSGNYILTRLIPFTRLSEDAFTTSLTYIRQGETEKAADAFSKRFGTKLGNKFSNIILKLDKLPPVEFLDQLTIVQNNAIQEHKTRVEEKLVKVHTLKKTLAVGEAILIMANFVYFIIIDSLQMISF